MKRFHRGFTIVELLVVVTIIVVLVSLLMPAMESAVYEAKLASCAANNRGIATGTIAYTADHNSFFPNRPSLDGASEPNVITDGGGDDRPQLKPYMPLKLFIDPFAPIRYPIEVADTRPGSAVYSSYPLWFGMRFDAFERSPGEVTPETKMLKLGDRLEWFDDADYSYNNEGKAAGQRGKLEKFAVLNGDQDFSGAQRRVINSHPDLALYPDYDTADSSGSPTKWNVNFARYQADAGTGDARGPVDSNYAFQDGSVRALRQVTLDFDERMGQVPFATMNGNWSLWTYQLPRNY